MKEKGEGGWYSRYMSISTSRKHGFTIVELLITIVVIAILAAVSVIAYRGVLDRARSSAVTSSLLQVSNKLEMYRTTEGSYPTSLAVVGVSNSENLKYEYTLDNNGNYCITGVDHNVSYFISSPAKKVTVGGCASHTWPGGIALVNLVPNGDFSQGTSSWLGYDASISASNGYLMATVNKVTGGVAARSYLSSSIVSGRVYYIKYAIKPFRTHQPLVIGLGVPAWMTPNALAGVETTVSARYTATAPNSYIDLRLNQASNSSIGSQVSFRYAMLVDLTTAFGTGKEPTKDQMDQVVAQFPNGWFNGSVTVSANGI